MIRNWLGIDLKKWLKYKLEMNCQKVTRNDQNWPKKMNEKLVTYCNKRGNVESHRGDVMAETNVVELGISSSGSGAEVVRK